MRLTFAFIAVPVLIVSLVAAQQKPAKATAKPAKANAPAESKADSSALPTEDEVNGFLQQTFGYDSSLTWKITSIKPSKAAGLAEVNVQISSPQGAGGQKFFDSEDHKHAVVGDIIPFGKRPFDEARLILEKNVNGPARGPANAPVTIVEFSDLQCPHCKEANPTVERLLSENPNIHFVFQNFPLAMHNWAQKGAAYADCVGKASNDAFWKFVHNVYEAQAEITAENADQKLTEIADKTGVKGADIAACSSTPETLARVEASQKLGESIDVNSTPTLFVNGRSVGVGSNNYDVLKQLVEFSAKEK